MTTLLGDLLLLGLLLTTALLRSLLLPGVLLGPPLRSLVGVARGTVSGERGAQPAQVGDDSLCLVLVLLLTKLVEQDVRPQVGHGARLTRFEAQLLLGQLHDLRVGDGDAVSLGDLRDDGGLDEGAGDVQPRRGLALLIRRLTRLGLHVLGDDVDVLLGHDDGVARTVQTGERHIGGLARTAGAARERPDGEKKCSAGGEDARACGEASGHGLLLERTTPEGDVVSQRCWPQTLPFRPRRRTQPVQPAPPGRHSYPCP